VGLIAALVMALVPYHVLFSRQVLLDGPMTFFATLPLLLLARFESSGRRAWLNAAAAAMGLTLLTNETSILLLGAAYAFFALTPQLRVRLRDLAVSVSVTPLVILPCPASCSGCAADAFASWAGGPRIWSGTPASCAAGAMASSCVTVPHPLGTLDAAPAARAHSPACGDGATG
jgi:Dolichyl-phosphate-mannose-protein mannosyltransferase